ncbi:hypothetical protein [Nocardioides sp. LML1-1-1.1]|uniref:hypothetical protein n=1 Tax=Nocardioides sp. LML1-1-1.1 TaxID=3135248 RepID=UPI00342D050A
MSTPHLVRSARLLAALVAASFAAIVALPRSGDRVVVVVTAVLALALLGVLGAAVRRGAVRPAAAAATALGAVAVAGAEAHLLSLPADGADIPLAGVGILFLGLVAVVGGAVCLAGRARR